MKIYILEGFLIPCRALVLEIPRKLFFFDFGLMYCDLWSQYINVRKLFEGGNYSRAETIWGNTVPKDIFLPKISKYETPLTSFHCSGKNIVYLSQSHKKTPQSFLYLLSMCLKIGSFLMQDGSNFMESRRDLEVVRSGLTILQTDTWVVCRFLYVPPQWVEIIFE